MKRYAVEVTDTTAAAILAHARYIAVDRCEPMGAQSWLESAWDVVDSLETMPKRCPIAPEGEVVPYEVRSILAGSVTLLFTVDEPRATVWVIAVAVRDSCHGRTICRHPSKRSAVRTIAKGLALELNTAGGLTSPPRESAAAPRALWSRGRRPTSLARARAAHW